MNLTLFTADCAGNKKNCRYPHKNERYVCRLCLKEGDDDLVA